VNQILYIYLEMMAWLHLAGWGSSKMELHLMSSNCRDRFSTPPLVDHSLMIILKPSLTISIILLNPIYPTNSHSSRLPTQRRIQSASRSNSVVVARERPTTVSVRDFAARQRTSTNLPSTVSSSVSPTVRSSARLLTPSLMEIASSLRLPRPSSLVTA